MEINTSPKNCARKDTAPTIRRMKAVVTSLFRRAYSHSSCSRNRRFGVRNYGNALGLIRFHVEWINLLAARSQFLGSLSNDICACNTIKVRVQSHSQHAKAQRPLTLIKDVFLIRAMDAIEHCRR